MNTHRRGTLAPLIDQYLTQRRKQGTYTKGSCRDVRARLTTLDQSFGDRPISQLGPRALDRWLESIDRLSPGSRSSYVASVKTFCTWLRREKIIRTDPTLELPLIRRPRAVPRSQTAEAVVAILHGCLNDREQAVVWLMVGLGLRRGEVAFLRWEHYDEARQILRVHGKGDNERWVPVTPEVAKALHAVREWGNSGPIICSLNDPCAGVLPETIGRLMTDLMTRAGVKRAPYDGVSGHALRHTAATDVLDQCGDLRVVQQMLGHQHLSSTSIYLGRAGMPKMRAAMEGRHYAA